MKRDFLGELETALPRISKRQRILAEYILENGGAAAYMTAAVLGQNAGVSESTVVRFAMSLGYRGYHQMQQAFRESLRLRLTTVQRIEDANDRMRDEDVIDSVLLADADKIVSALHELDRSAFDRAIDILLSAKRIYIVGMRSSAILAQFMNYYLRLLFDNVSLVCPSGGSEVFEHLINLAPGDAVFAISFPRYSSGTVRAAEFAHRRGAGVIVLTDSAGSPIARNANVVLTAKSEMASFVDSLVAPMSIINAIIAYIGKKRPQEVAEKFRVLEDVWNEYKVYSE